MVFKGFIWSVRNLGVLGAFKGALQTFKGFMGFRDAGRRRAGKRWAEGDGRVRARAARGGGARTKARGGREGGGGGGWVVPGWFGGMGGSSPPNTETLQITTEVIQLGLIFNAP
jgi:hypothetical protein